MRKALEQNVIIKHIVVIGFKADDHTHHYIHKMYVRFLKHYYPALQVRWFETEMEFSDNIAIDQDIQNTMIMISPCHKKLSHHNLPIGAFYILHLDQFHNGGYKSMDEFFGSWFGKQMLLSKRFVVLTCREKIYSMRYFDRDAALQTICLPWFANVLQIEMTKSSPSMLYDEHVKKQYIAYIGSIWKLNIGVICKLIDVCERHHIHLLLKGRVFGITNEKKKYIESLNKTHTYVRYVPFHYHNSTENNENTLEYIDEKYGVKALLPLQGEDHHADYLSNRLFETISMGFLAVSNNPLVKSYMPSILYDDDIERLILQFLQVLDNKDEWIQKYEAQRTEFLDKFYGLKNIQQIFNFFQEVMSQHGIKLEIPTEQTTKQL